MDRIHFRFVFEGKRNKVSVMERPEEGSDQRQKKKKKKKSKQRGDLENMNFVGKIGTFLLKMKMR